MIQVDKCYSSISPEPRNDQILVRTVLDVHTLDVAAHEPRMLPLVLCFVAHAEAAVAFTALDDQLPACGPGVEVAGFGARHVE